MFLGEADKVTLDKNYYHDMSGRSPKVGGESDSGVLMQASNNVFSNFEGHAFDVATGAYVLIEGNYFSGVDTPITSSSSSAGGYVFDVPDSSASSTCSSYLGRTCPVNSLTSSGTWTSLTSTNVLSQLSSYKGNLVTPSAASSIYSSVTASAGIGHL